MTIEISKSFANGMKWTATTQVKGGGIVVPVNDLARLSDEEAIRMLRSMIDTARYLTAALTLIEKAKAESQSRETGKTTAVQKRKDTRARYDSLFVDIGRRDGFLCAMCGHAGNNLQIDHITPVAKGGTNDLGNLQLLCPPCNLAKSDL